MSKVYNTQGDLAILLSQFFDSIHDLSKPQKKIIPFIILGMVQSESVVSADIISKLKGDFELNLNDSNLKRIWRFFNNPRFDIISLYDSFIKYIIANYKIKHSDNRIHISFDHMFCKSRTTVLAFSLRIGRQAIPLWFRCFKGKLQQESCSEDLIIDGINYISNLFKQYNYDLIFLADRWFNSVNVMKHIDSLNHKFVIRVKTNIKVFSKHKRNQYQPMIWRYLSDINPKIHHAKIIKNVFFSINNPYLVNLVISKSDGTDDPFYLVTNADPIRAAKDYGYRWSIECMFKNEKSNGFCLEATNTRNQRAFTNVFGFASIALIWMTILGTDYSRNKHHKNNFITDTKKINGGTKRMISLFKVGLRYFNLAFNSIIYRSIKCNFILYDV